MRATENEKRDWTVIALILLLGLLGMLLAGGWALRFTPLWELDANVESLLDPNSDFLTHRPQGFIEPVDPAILTNVAWVEVYLTPGATFSSVTQYPPLDSTSFATPTAGTQVATQLAPSTTVVVVTNTALLPSPTNTFVYFPLSPSSTPKPKPAATSISAIAVSATPTSTSNGFAPSTATPTASAMPSQTFTPTATPTSTPTATVTDTSTPTATATIDSTPTHTPTPSSTPSPTNTLSPTPVSTSVPLALSCFISPVTIGASGTYAVPSGGSCFRFSDPGFTNGGVFTIQELSATSGNLVWFGKVDPADTSCSTYPQAVGLPASGAVTIAVHKFIGFMYVEVSGSTSVQIDIVSWNDTGCP